MYALPWRKGMYAQPGSCALCCEYTKQIVILNENGHQLYTVYQTQARFLLLIAPSPSRTI